MSLILSFKGSAAFLKIDSLISSFLLNIIPYFLMELVLISDWNSSFRWASAVEKLAPSDLSSIGFLPGWG